MNDVLGENLRRIRKEAHISQAQLAEMSGISQSAISDIENPNATKSPSIYTVYQVARSIGCSIYDLLGEPSTDKTNTSNTLSTDETSLISFYRSMNTEAKKTILNMARLAAGNPSAQEGLIQKNSIS